MNPTPTGEPEIPNFGSSSRAESFRFLDLTKIFIESFPKYNIHSISNLVVFLDDGLLISPVSEHSHELLTRPTV